MAGGTAARCSRLDCVDDGFGCMFYAQTLRVLAVCVMHERAMFPSCFLSLRKVEMGVQIY